MEKKIVRLSRPLLFKNDNGKYFLAYGFVLDEEKLSDDYDKDLDAYVSYLAGMHFKTAGADYFDVSMDYLYGRTDDPHGMYYSCKTPKVEKSYPEMDKFIEMCFEPGTAMNERLKETLRTMMKEERE